MAQGPSDTILVAIRITLWIRESKVRNPDHPDRRRFVLCECILVMYTSYTVHWVQEKECIVIISSAAWKINQFVEHLMVQ